MQGLIGTHAKSVLRYGESISYVFWGGDACKRDGECGDGGCGAHHGVQSQLPGVPEHPGRGVGWSVGLAPGGAGSPRPATGSTTTGGLIGTLAKSVRRCRESISYGSLRFCFGSTNSRVGAKCDNGGCKRSPRTRSGPAPWPPAQAGVLGMLTLIAPLPDRLIRGQDPIHRPLRAQVVAFVEQRRHDLRRRTVPASGTCTSTPRSRNSDSMKAR